MRLTLDLPTDVSIALRRFAAGIDESLEFAAVEGLRDWLIGAGYLEDHGGLEDMEPEGSA